MSKSTNRHLIVDAQILQSAARRRGIGRYSENLLSAIIANGSYDSVKLIFSKRTHDTNSDDKDPINNFHSAEVIYLDLRNTSKSSIEETSFRNKGTINKYIRKLNINPKNIDFLILSPFQEPIVSVFPDGVNKFLVFYDLIPYLYSQQYEREMYFDQYLKRFTLLFEADKLLTISGAVGEDLATYLGIPETRICPIYGAPVRSDDELTDQAIQLPKNYILMPTGGDIRKNNERAVAGFEEFNKKSKHKYKLLVTSHFSRPAKTRLRKISKNIIFTDSVSHTQMDRLYEKSHCVLFVPESEGLGLPVLEGISHSKSVVCSDLDVFHEIKSSALVFCDHTKPDAIASSLDAALKKRINSKIQNENKRTLEFFSWEKTAERAIKYMSSSGRKELFRKPKIAIFTPKPDGLSAIGKVVAESHATLSEYFDIDYYAESGPEAESTRPNYLQYLANYYPATYFSVTKYADYDAVFYHIGNSEYHLESIANSLYMPGYVIIHDTNISDAFRVMTERNLISRNRMELEAHMTKVAKTTQSKSMISVVSNQLAVLTHSKFATSAVNEASVGDSHRVGTVNLPTRTPREEPRRTRKKLTFGLAGIIADIKGTEVIEMLAKDQRYANHTLSIFGYSYSPASTINRLRSYDNLEVATNVSDLDFLNKMKELDVFVNYRMQYQGETSLSTLEAMRQGVVVIVRNVGWYSELPDDAVIKVNTIDEVVDKLNHLVDNIDVMDKLSRNAIKYVRENHSHENYAKRMLEIINEKKDPKNKNVQTAKRLWAGSINTKSDLFNIRGA